MAKITIEINLDNDAFQDSDLELISLLRKIANKIESNGTDYLADYPLHDTNGADCGICTLDVGKEYEDYDSDEESAIRDDEEQTRRDQKNGLYPEFWDVAN